MLRNRLFSLAVSCLLAALILFDSASAQDGGCGTVLTPEQIELELALDPADYRIHRRGAEIIHYVPITFHVVRQSNGTGGLSVARQTLALQDLNLRYEPVGIQFFRYRDGAEYFVDYIDDDLIYTGTNNNAAYNALRNMNRVENTANVWFCPNTGLCGLSSFTGGGTQGSIVDNACVALPGNKSTFAHEIGHYFNLYHTHETAFGEECPDGTNCLDAGDRLCDTPADPNLQTGVGGGCLYSGALTPPFGCGGTYDPMVENLMSYAPKACRDTFTPDQIAKMIWTLENLRPELFLYDSSDNDIDGFMDVADNCPEVFNPDQTDADLDGFGDACLHSQISFDKAIGSVPLEVQFTGATDLIPTGWDWEFGDGEFSSDQNPLHSYTTPGWYDIRLTVTTADSSHTAQHLTPIIVVADTLDIGEAVSESGEAVQIQIYMRNSVAISQMVIPFSWTGDFDLSVNSISTTGLRTEYFEIAQLSGYDPFNNRAAIWMVSSTDNSFPALAPDTGAVVTLNLTPSSPATGEVTDLTIGSWGPFSLYATSSYGSYQPTAQAGSVTGPTYVCGDADGSGGISIADVTFLIAHIFSGGASPVPPQAGDADGSGGISIADVTYLIAHIFSAGAAPVCP